FGIAGHGRGLVAGSQRALVAGIDVVDIEDDASPPRPALLVALRDQVEIAGSGAKAGERGHLAAIQHSESERTVEPDSTTHVVGGERNGADALDHHNTSAMSNWCTACFNWPALSRLAHR